MAWNEPGGGDKDPWGGRKSDQGPPDLDEIVRTMQRKFGGLFGGGGTRTGGSSAGGGIGLIVVLALVVWLLYDISYIIQPAQRGVVLRFGAYADTLEPGFNMRLPRPIEHVVKVDIDQVRSVPHKALMLTQDENIVDIKLAVQYKVKDARAYLFNVRDADGTLEQATKSALREVVGKSKMDYVITDGRDAIAVSTQQLLQEIIDKYVSGLQVIKVTLQDANPPEQVKDAFDDAIKAREDEQRFKNEAEAYANEIIPKARGAAARLTEESTAYKAQVVARAEGEASRFTQLLAEYEKAPAVTRERLYLDTIEGVLGNTSKIMIDVKDGNNIMYLPLDRMLQGGGVADTGQTRRFTPDASGSTPREDQRTRDSLRTREGR
jgi:membrane protease subunit HflK